MPATFQYKFEPVLAYTDWRKLQYITDRVGMTFVLHNDGRWSLGGLTDYHQISNLLKTKPGTPVKPTTRLSHKTLARLEDAEFKRLLCAFEEQVKREGVPSFQNVTLR